MPKNGSRKSGRPQWTQSLLRQAVEALQIEYAGQSDPAVIDALVCLGTQPDIWPALCGRTDPKVAVQDLATRYAFAALMEAGRPIQELDRTSQLLVQRALDLIRAVDAQMAAGLGENPLDEEPNLLLSICKCLSRYIPRKPMEAHIRWKIQHYESAASRAMRQIENLVQRPELREPLVAYLLEADLPAEHKAGLLQLARGGGRQGVDQEATIRFFARPEMVAFVKRFAETVQTARTLYQEEEYRDSTWRGQRGLPAKRRQGYLEAALASLDRRADRSLDRRQNGGSGMAEEGYHELIKAQSAWPDEEALISSSMAGWITRHALTWHPEDPIWQACEQVYLNGLDAAEIIAHGLADSETINAARQRMTALQADPAVQEAWLETQER